MNTLWKKIRQTFEIPFDPLDEDSNQSNILSSLMNILILILAVYLIFILLVRGSFSIQIYAILGLILTLSIMRIALSEKNLQIISWTLVSIIWLYTSIIFFFYENGLRAPVLTAVYIFLIVYVSLLHGRKAAISFSILIIFTSLLVGFLEFSGIFLTEPKVPDIRFTLIGLVIFIPAISFLLLRTLANLRQTISLYKIELANRINVEKEINQLNRELEQRVEERTAQLEEANQDLESFSYSVSHDLRAPLRSIVGFSNAIFEDHIDSLDKESLEYLQRIEISAKKMDSMISGLLDLSKIARTDIQTDSVNLSEIALEIIQDLPAREREQLVEIKITPNIQADGDERLLRVLMQNLLNNAWKFSRDNEKVVIDFSQEVQDGHTVYFVRDNGVGFNSNSAHRLFDQFQRLHGEEEFSGYGIGLATCRKIVQRHGGEIWAESQIGKGATFYFTLGE